MGLVLSLFCFFAALAVYLVGIVTMAVALILMFSTMFIASQGYPVLAVIWLAFWIIFIVYRLSSNEDKEVRNVKS